MSSPAFSCETPTAERIAEIAASLFAERGYAAVSMREIASAVGMKAASLYNHFADKESLYLAAVTQAFSGIASAIDEATAVEGTPHERLQALIAALAGNHFNDDMTAKLLQREVLDGDEDRLNWISENLFKQTFHQFSDVLGEIMHSDDSDRMALFVCGLVTGYTSFAPFFKRVGGDAFITDTSEFSNEIASRMVRNLERTEP